jgi:L,D-transpeptidase YbiS
VIVPPDRQSVAPRPPLVPSTEPPGPGLVGAAAVARPERRPLPQGLRLAGLALAAVAVVALGGAIGLARFGGAYERERFAPRLVLPDNALEPEETARRAARVEKRLASLAPRHETYVVIDTYGNRLKIFKNGEMVRDAMCSTGSGVRLRDPRNGKEWIFDTPQGELRILRKVKDPVWIKPDWAFVEEGFEPPRSQRERVDDYSLGDYGLYMRDGYIIHGTIFKTLLGKRVTHGCIRLGDEDLEFAYKTIPVGARVFLF